MRRQKRGSSDFQLHLATHVVIIIYLDGCHIYACNFTITYYQQLFCSDFNDLPTDNLTDDVANVSCQNLGSEAHALGSYIILIPL